MSDTKLNSKFSKVAKRLIWFNASMNILESIVLATALILWSIDLWVPYPLSTGFNILFLAIAACPVVFQLYKLFIVSEATESDDKNIKDATTERSLQRRRVKNTATAFLSFGALFTYLIPMPFDPLVLSVLFFASACGLRASKLPNSTEMALFLFFLTVGALAPLLYCGIEWSNIYLYDGILSQLTIWLCLLAFLGVLSSSYGEFYLAKHFSKVLEIPKENLSMSYPTLTPFSTVSGISVKHEPKYVPYNMINGDSDSDPSDVRSKQVDAISSVCSVFDCVVDTFRNS